MSITTQLFPVLTIANSSFFTVEISSGNFEDSTRIIDFVVTEVLKAYGIDELKFDSESGSGTEEINHSRKKRQVSSQKNVTEVISSYRKLKIHKKCENFRISKKFCVFSIFCFLTVAGALPSSTKTLISANPSTKSTKSANHFPNVENAQKCQHAQAHPPNPSQ